MPIKESAKLVRMLHTICRLSNSHGCTREGAIEAHVQVRRVASEAMTEVLMQMVADAKAETDARCRQIAGR